ncbi:hypothetical protein F2Q69_00061711 [Brassica cretica]|uniref:Uncharacterized protein n=1 Tax=Brassica cretica TaxID=69181 RepID=A0A8S9RKS6_BRACR|nr:hypothetical protein F2Q69_00061711 [Brassica cretica]
MTLTPSTGDSDDDLSATTPTPSADSETHSRQPHVFFRRGVFFAHKVGELKRHKDEMMGHFGGYLNDFQEFEPVVNDLIYIHRSSALLSLIAETSCGGESHIAPGGSVSVISSSASGIEEVVTAGDDEAGSSSFCGVSHPPEKPSIAEEPATSLSPFSTARATSL